MAFKSNDGCKTGTGIVDGMICKAGVVHKQHRMLEIEKGYRSKINAIVVHQTGGTTVQSAFNEWKNSQLGTHFIIDRDGTVYQVASVDQRTDHIKGNRLQSKALNEFNGDFGGQRGEWKIAEEARLFQKGKTQLAQFERSKKYPARYPTSDDSIGIELVGPCVDKKGKIVLENDKECTYVDPTPAQNASLTNLVRLLKSAYDLRHSDVYTHPEIQYEKRASEAKGANWAVELVGGPVGAAVGAAAPSPSRSPSPSPSPSPVPYPGLR
jgi:N-acetyl-anhydromuramyl-L-alanine amidase AmpD